MDLDLEDGDLLTDDSGAPPFFTTAKPMDLDEVSFLFDLIVDGDGSQYGGAEGRGGRQQKRRLRRLPPSLANPAAEKRLKITISVWRVSQLNVWCMSNSVSNIGPKSRNFCIRAY